VLRNNEIGVQRYELCCRPLPHLGVIEGTPTKIETNVASFCPTQIVQTFPERGHVILEFRITFGMRHQHPDPAHRVGLLADRRERPRSRAAQDSDELSSLRSLPRL